MYRLKKEGWLKHWDFFLMDLAWMQIAFFISSLLILQLKNYTYYDTYRNQALILFLCAFMYSFLGDPYKGILYRSGGQEFIHLVQDTAYMMVLNLTFLYFIHIAQHMSRLVFGLTWVLFFPLSFIGRQLRKKVLMHRRGGAMDAKSMIVLTRREDLEALTKELEEQPLGGYFIAGVFLKEAQKQEIRQEAAPILGDFEMAQEYALRHWVDEVFIKLPQDEEGSVRLREAFLNMGITVHEFLAEVRQSALSEDNHVIETYGCNVVSTYAMHQVSAGALAFKRAMDIAGGFVGSILTLVLLVFIGPAIFIQSPGPVFFSQVRIGKNGRPFKMYKFRSMVPHAEEGKDELRHRNMSPDGMMFKVEDDPRVIGSGKKDRKGRPAGIGNFIRRTSIDEFPQFFNVLKGDMSLVGTRPPTQDEWEKYQQNHRMRMSVRPGITGAWQVSGRSEMMDFDQVVKLDSEYIRNWSLMLDLKILGKTFSALWSGK